MHRLCFENQDFPHVRTVYRWLEKHEEFRHEYARAKEEQVHRLGEEILAIVDETEHDTLAEVAMKTTEGFIVVKKENKEFVNSKRLRMDARKWLMAKLLPRVYGDKAGDEGSTAMKIIVVEEGPDDGGDD